MTLELAVRQTVQRQDPGGHRTFHEIRNEQELKYHEGLMARGYRYTVVSGTGVDPFDLPVLLSNLSPSPRLHQLGDSVCLSCEG